MSVGSPRGDREKAPGHPTLALAVQTFAEKAGKSMDSRHLKNFCQKAGKSFYVPSLTLRFTLALAVQAFAEKAGKSLASRPLKLLPKSWQKF